MERRQDATKRHAIGCPNHLRCMCMCYLRSGSVLWQKRQNCSLGEIDNDHQFKHFASCRCSQFSIFAHCFLRLRRPLYLSAVAQRYDVPKKPLPLVTPSLRSVGNRPPPLPTMRNVIYGRPLRLIANEKQVV